MVSWDGLQSVSVAFSGRSHLLFGQKQLTQKLTILVNIGTSRLSPTFVKNEVQILIHQDQIC